MSLFSELLVQFQNTKPVKTDSLPQAVCLCIRSRFELETVPKIGVRDRELLFIFFSIKRNWRDNGF